MCSGSTARPTPSNLDGLLGLAALQGLSTGQGSGCSLRAPRPPWVASPPSLLIPATIIMGAISNKPHYTYYPAKGK